MGLVMNTWGLGVLDPAIQISKNKRLCILNDVDMEIQDNREAA